MKVLDIDGLNYYDQKIKNTYATKEYVLAELEDYATLTDLEDYLPLSGGTMTGDISFNKENPTIKGNLIGGGMRIYAGANNFDGATLQMFGRNDSTYGGNFYLRASTKSSDNDSSGSSYTLVGKADGTLTWNGTEISLNGHTHSYLPLTGGLLTGNLDIKKGSPLLYFDNSNVTRNTAPSADQSQGISFRDNNSTNVLGMVQNVYRTSKENSTRLVAYKGTTTDSTWTSLTVGYDSSGNPFTYAPTPAAGDNSNNIATTAFVHNYLPLSGGTMTGNLAANKTEFWIGNSTANNAGIISLRSANASYKNGAALTLYGIGTTNGGRFLLQAADGTNTPSLVGSSNGSLTWNGHSIVHEQAKTKSNSSNLSSSTSYTNKASLSLSAGTWLVCATAMFPTNATGARGIRIDAGSTIVAEQTNPAIAGSSTSLTTSGICSLTGSTTVYAAVKQNSGSTLNSVITVLYAQKLSDYTAFA